MAADYSLADYTPGVPSIPADCVSPDLAKLYEINGAAADVRYADRGAYTGMALPPPPSTCPAGTPNLHYCGGACGDCPKDFVCMGRSPLHPVSICVNKRTATSPYNDCVRGTGMLVACNGSTRCLTFKVDDASQPVADANSFCVDTFICEDAAKTYGAFCTVGTF